MQLFWIYTRNLYQKQLANYFSLRQYRTIKAIYVVRIIAEENNIF